MSYSVYIMANTRSRAATLYVGMTNDLERRTYEHRRGTIQGFTAKYKLTTLVYYEDYDNVLDAISREKQIKGWRRSRKIELIESLNPEWHNLAEGWFAQDEAH